MSGIADPSITNFVEPCLSPVQVRGARPEPQPLRVRREGGGEGEEHLGGEQGEEGGGEGGETGWGERGEEGWRLLQSLLHQEPLQQRQLPTLVDCTGTTWICLNSAIVFPHWVSG